MYKAIEDSLIQKYKGWKGASQFEGSGVRLERLMGEMCYTSEGIYEVVRGCFKSVFEDSYDEMLVAGPIEVWTLCPHHLLPCSFKVHIGYIPKGKVLGLSKFGRVAVVMGKRPVMQEMYSRELADVFCKNLEPEGLGVRVVGRHGCMEARGLKQGLDVVTSVLRGSFKEDPTVRKEFFALVDNG